MNRCHSQYQTRSRGLIRCERHAGHLFAHSADLGWGVLDAYAWEDEHAYVPPPMPRVSGTMLPPAPQKAIEA